MKRTHFGFAFLFFASSTMLSAQSTESLDTAAIARIKEEGLTRSHALETLTMLTDVHGPRLNWSPEYRDAANWVMSVLRSYGVKNVHTENCGPLGRGWTLKGFTAQAISPHAFPLIAWPKAWSPGTHGTVRGDAVVLKVSTEADFATYKGRLKNAIVLISDPVAIPTPFEPDAMRENDSTLLKMANAGLPSSRRRGGMFRDSSAIQRYFERAQMNARKLAFCLKERAALVLDAGRGSDGTLTVQQAALPVVPQKVEDLFGGRANVYDADAPKTIPQVTVAAEHYNRIVRMVDRGQKVRLEFSLDVDTTPADSCFNVIAEIPGTDLTDEVVLIGAHLDSWQAATGATDNATGVTTVMETARILQTLGLKPRRTIRLGLWCGEEQGFLGSRGYAARHLAERSERAGSVATSTPEPMKKKPEYETFSVYLNNDNGAGRVRGVYLQGNEAARTVLRAWLEQYGDPSAQTLTLNNTGGTDHTVFDGIGLPGFQFIQDRLDYSARTHHTNMDCVERVPEEDLKQASTIMAVFAYNAAMSDAKFPRKPSSPSR